MLRRTRIVEGSSQGGGTSSGTQTKQLLKVALTAGNNTIAHGVSGTITSYHIFNDTDNNREMEFSDIYADSTNIYIYSDADYSSVTININYL
jgi:hypothetical protein